MTIDLKKLLDDEDFGGLFAHLCDLEPEAEGDADAWFTIDGRKDITVLAHDGTGGIFVTVPSSPYVIYAGSEGNCGVIAGSVDEFVALVVTCPFWERLLRISGGGKLEEMYRAYPVLEAAWLDDYEENEELRSRLLKKLDLAPHGDPVGALHANVTGTNIVIADARDGSSPPSLIGDTTIDQVPWLKPYIK